MKQCPVCKTNYTDDSLQFCLSDGAGLISLPDEAETIQMSADRRPMRIDFDNNTAPINVPQTSANIPVKKGCSPLLIAGLLVLLFISLSGIAAAVYFFVPLNGKNTPDNLANGTPTVSPSPKSNSIDEANLKIANLQKQLDEQKNKKIANQQPSPSKTVKPVQTPPPSTTTARVGSTGDGFLSLRTEASVKTGVQIVKIPTGATVEFVGKCQNPGRTADGKTGRWCLVSYNNQTGWVFDAYLIY